VNTEHSPTIVKRLMLTTGPIFHVAEKNRGNRESAVAWKIATKSSIIHAKITIL